MRRAFLVPGFFGFSEVGRMAYFKHVRAALEGAMRERGEFIALTSVPTAPTASIETRARRLAEVIVASSEPGDTIHVVGHSTGGLDGRFLASPGNAGRFGARFEALRPGLRSVLGVTTPHQGAPLARFLVTLRGEAWLRVLSVLTLAMVRLGSWSRVALEPLLTGLANAQSMPDDLFDQVWTDVISDFSPETRRQLIDFFAEVRRDRTLLKQLQPEGVAQLADALVEAGEVQYGSIVADVPKPAYDGPARGPSRHLFRFLADLSVASGELGGPTDGFVPVRSQRHGEVVAEVKADHLDVIGYFHAPDEGHADWLDSGAGLTTAGFRALWQRVAGWMLQAEPAQLA